MLLLVHKAHASLDWSHPNLGRLVSPRQYARIGDACYRWAADNDAYAAWDEGRFVAMLDTVRSVPSKPLFVTAPDVVADWSATRRLFDTWLPVMDGLPIAYVLQDGQPADSVPWNDIAAVFVGGSTEYKLGGDAAQLAQEAKRLGKWVHMGRVNTRRRIQYAKAIGCDSIDGTQASMFTDTHLPWMLERAGASPQLMLQQFASDPVR